MFCPCFSLESGGQRKNRIVDRSSDLQAWIPFKEWFLLAIASRPDFSVPEKYW